MLSSAGEKPLPQPKLSPKPVPKLSPGEGAARRVPPQHLSERSSWSCRRVQADGLPPA